jgi:hypothetical protein
MKHTPEPWKRGLDDISIVGSENYPIVRISYFREYHEQDKNLNRIISCVNAMAGIEDPQKFRDTWEAIKHLELDAYQEAQEQIERKNVELMNQSALLDIKDQRITDLENVLKDLKTTLDRDQSIHPGTLMQTVIERCVS